MKSSLLVMSMALLGLAFTVGCGASSESSAGSAAEVVDVDGSFYQLADEPDGAVGVIEAHETAEDGAPLVLMGRIGGAEYPWIEGRAAFTLLDASLTVVAEGEDTDEGEICLAECCATELAGYTTLVKVVDGQGKVVSVDSRKLFGLQEEDMVVVSGTAQKDERGNFVMLAEGVYVRN